MRRYTPRLRRSDQGLGTERAFQTSIRRAFFAVVYRNPDCGSLAKVFGCARRTRQRVR